MAEKQPPRRKLTAPALKDALWATLQDLREGELDPAQGDAIAVQGREIVRVTRAQLAISRQANQGVPADLLEFSNPGE